MADPEFSREEVQGTIFHGAPQQSVAMPVEQKATAAIPVPPPLTIKSVEKSKPVANKINASALVETVGSANKQLQESIPKPEAPSAIHGLVEEISNNWKPLAVVGGLTAAALVGKRLLNRKEAVTALATRVEPTFATAEETATFKPIEQPTGPTKLAAESEAKFGVPLSDVENHFGVKVTNIKDAEILSNNYKNSLSGAVGNAPAGVPGVNPMDQLTTQPPAPQLIQPKPPAGATPPAPAQIPVTSTPSVGEAVATGGNVDQAIKQTVANQLDAVAPPAELRTGTGKIAYAGQGPEPTIGKKGPQFRNEYQSLEAVPKGYAFVPGAQYADPLRNDLGQAEYTKAFTGREFPTTYDEAIATGKDINRSLGRATREEAKAAGLPKAETTEGIFKKTTENKKLVKIIGKAGLAGALVSLADLALAKTPEQKSNAGLNLLGAILPPGMDINAAGAGSTLSPEVVRRNQIAYENQFKLGSPYAQTPEAKAYRLREKAGAGRGIAPPSAYQR